MRNTVMIAIVLLCCPVFAADHWRVSILAAEISNGGNRPWSDDPHAGISVGVAYAPTPQWDAELTVASQTHRSPYTRLFYMPVANEPGIFVPATEFREYTVRPFDFSVTRHFFPANRVVPYVRAGVRYVDAPADPPQITIVPRVDGLLPVGLGYGFDDRTSAQAGAGVRVKLTPRTALRGEATRLIRSEAADFDPLTRYAVGVSWLF